MIPPKQNKTKDVKVNGKEAEWITENGNHVAIGENGEVVAGNPKAVGNTKKVDSSKEKRVDPGKKEKKVEIKRNVKPENSMKYKKAKANYEEIKSNFEKYTREASELKKKVDKLRKELNPVFQKIDKANNKVTKEDKQQLKPLWDLMDKQKAFESKAKVLKEYYLDDAKNKFEKIKKQKFNTPKYSSVNEALEKSSEQSMNEICSGIEGGYLTEFRNYHDGSRDSFAGKATNAFMENLDYYSNISPEKIDKDQRKAYEAYKPFCDLYNLLEDDNELKEFKKDIKKYMSKKYPKNKPNLVAGS